MINTAHLSCGYMKVQIRIVPQHFFFTITFPISAMVFFSTPQFYIIYIYSSTTHDIYHQVFTRNDA